MFFLFNLLLNETSLFITDISLALLTILGGIYFTTECSGIVSCINDTCDSVLEFCQNGGREIMVVSQMMHYPPCTYALICVGYEVYKVILSFSPSPSAT